MYYITIYNIYILYKILQACFAAPCNLGPLWLYASCICLIMPKCFDLHGVVFSSAENAKPSYIDGFDSSEHPDLLMSSSPTYRNQTGGISKKGFLARNLFWLLRNTIQMWCAGALAMEDRQDFGMSSFYVMDACKFEHLGGPRFKWNSKHNMDFFIIPTPS